MPVGSGPSSPDLLAVPAHGGEEDARVEDSKQEAGDEDEGAVEDEEAGLVLHDFVAPAAGHFSNTFTQIYQLYFHIPTILLFLWLVERGEKIKGKGVSLKGGLR